MTILRAGATESISLQKFETLTVVADASGSGTITRLPNATGGPSGGYQTIVEGQTIVIGPFGETTQHKIDARESSLTVTVGLSAVPVFPTTDPGVENAAYWDGDTLTKSAGPVEAPNAFTAEQWSVVDAETSGDITVTVDELPDDNNSTITDMQYSISNGDWVSFGAAVADDYTISGLEDDVAVTIRLRVINAVGTSPVSDSKLVTPTAGA